MKQTAFLREKRRVYTVFKVFSTYICWIIIWNATLYVSGAVLGVVRHQRVNWESWRRSSAKTKQSCERREVLAVGHGWSFVWIRASAKLLSEWRLFAGEIIVRGEEPGRRIWNLVELCGACLVFPWEATCSVRASIIICGKSFWRALYDLRNVSYGTAEPHVLGRL
jgi:hypothetical protein